MSHSLNRGSLQKIELMMVKADNIMELTLSSELIEELLHEDQPNLRGHHFRSHAIVKQVVVKVAVANPKLEVLEPELVLHHNMATSETVHDMASHIQ